MSPKQNQSPEAVKKEIRLKTWRKVTADEKIRIVLEGPKGETSIAVEHGIPERAHVKVTILDILGQQVRTLVDETQDAGYFEVTWDGANAGDKPVATGIFADRIQAGDYVAIREQFNE